MLNDTRVFFVLTIGLISIQMALGQYTTTRYIDPLKQTVVMDQYNDPHAFTVTYDEMPHPAGKAARREALRQQKLAAQRMTPHRPNVISSNRGSLPAPEILASFTGNNVITGTPLDNHLAISPAEQPVSVINTHMLVTNNTGFWLGSYNLANFFGSVGTVTHFFDPRIIYDPEQDRFILVLINGSRCHDSQIVLAFSQTSNPRGAWNLYALDGCLNDDGTFADYPMISITKNELFLTYNEVHSDSTWQAGFFGTQIHQINKMNGYNGETLQRRVWQDISYNGRLLRNICPVRNADEVLPSSMYFLSTRNFDLSNDTLFVLHLTGEQDDAEAAINMSYRVMDLPYGVPPYAVQPKDSFDTNDGRVLDAFELAGRIQWVSNSMDFNSGRSAVYHGIILADDPGGIGEGHIIAHATDYLGYPGIAWTGHDPSQQDAIIVVSHCSPIRNPGGSAIYTDGYGQYSDFVSIIEGFRPIDMLPGMIERWGDYIGIQRLYHQPGSVWISCSYGRFNFNNEAWIAKLARQEENVSVNQPQRELLHIAAYPNPSEDYVRIDLDNPEARDFKVILMDARGVALRTLYDGPAEYPGKASLTFSVHTLPAGHYIVHVVAGGAIVTSKSIVRL